MRRDYPDTAVVPATAYTSLSGTAADAPLPTLIAVQARAIRARGDRGRDWRQQTLREIEWQAHSP